MKVTFDRKANAAYISLARGDGTDARASQTESVEAPHIKGTINLDFNARGRLIGIEVLNATRLLPYELLHTAERI